ncbi:DUF3794 and LysM peptidoglycan-binding domain-containing protein [Tepidibacter mesophilus]|uniref:DUF3794 and LysM peptidoglycan-binding domain-containing protein n=1 Tax=Tepidibacter mesophilus TaxID=655607 RepID=UPI000C06FE82|nr:SPOCS domain-containing protein [Tepidibacter mesophilus]
MDLIKDIMKIDNRSDFGRFQTFLESEILVPDTKDDVFEIVKADAYISLKKEELMQGKIILRGDLNYNTIYITQDKQVTNLSGKIDINEAVEKEDISPAMKSILQSNIEHIDCSIINERKIKLGCLINITGSLFSREKVDIIRDITGIDDIQTSKKEIYYDDVIGIEKSETIVNEIINLGENQDISSVLSLNPKVFLKETRLSDNKVILGGVVELNPIVLNKEEEMIKLRSNSVEFTQFIEVAGATQGMKQDSYMNLTDFKFNLKDDDSGKTNLVEIDATVSTKVKVSENIVKETLQDAYCPYKDLKLEDKSFDLNKIVDFGEDDFIINEVIQNDRDDIEIKEILNVDSKLFITDNFIIEEKMNIEGIIHVDILYTPVEGLRPIYSMSEEIPFKQSIDLSNINDSMKPYSNINIDSINYSIQKNEIELKIKGKTRFEIVEDLKSSFVINGEIIGDIDSSSRPSITIYIAKENDTLWDVAKRYNTTASEIAQTNDMNEEDSLKEGQYLIIEKKVTLDI